MTNANKVMYMFLGAIYLVLGFMTGLMLVTNVILGTFFTALDVVTVCCWYVMEKNEED